MNMRIGHGYDVHRLVEGRKLIIGGVDIPFEKGLLGHSDADVLSHAIAAAILGACVLPDIGNLFPDNDPAYEGISSLMLLSKVSEKINEKNIKIVNIDSTVIAQRPKLAPYIREMCKNIAFSLGISAEDVNIKATTEENLGFTGNEEGITAHAVCLVETQKSL